MKTNVPEIKAWWHQKRAIEMAEILNNAGYTVEQVDNLQEARDKVLELIPQGSSISVGGSATLEATDLLDIFRTDKYRFFDRYEKKPYEERLQIMREAMLADYLVMGCNAITKQGQLVNRDSSGNRVAGIMFGPTNVIVLAGVNKLVDNLDAAFKRLNERVAPMNVKRLGTHKTPCLETGYCMDCDVKHRICNFTSIVEHGHKFPDRITIIVIADEVGF
jgi:hypothetical protein